MLIFPNINPVIISIGPFAIHWYSLAYITGILFGWYYSNKLVEKFPLNITKRNIEDFVTWSIIGIIIGGRLGYVFFYDPIKYLKHPIDILKTYEGGMSFHGGTTGLILSAYFFGKKYKINFLRLIDLMAVVSPLGLFLGRIGNFINGELYGRITDVPWGVIFPNSDMMPRHPSQIYEAIGEGIVLLAIMACAVFRFQVIKYEGKLAGIFLIYYSIFRIFIENFREPNFHLGFILPYITMGQILSFPMLLIGFYLLLRSKCQSMQR